MLLSVNASAQSVNNVDPGFSVHNYKQPHKAKLAKKMDSKLNNPNVEVTVESRIGNRFNHTPKYAARPATIILGATQSGKEFNLNPLQSPHHYKLHDVEVDRMLVSRSRVAKTTGSTDKKKENALAE